MPPRFRLPEIGHDGNNVLNDVWIALDQTGTAAGSADGGFFFAYARLKPGVSFAQADADVKRVAADIARRDPASHPAYTARLDSLRTMVVSGIRPTLLMLLAAAALLFFVTCANVAALLLARSIARARDSAIRVALGAGRRHLALQFFLEGLFVSLTGAAIGVLLSIVLVRIVVSMAADFVPRADEIAIDWRVLTFALTTAILSSALSSLTPLWQAARTQPKDALGAGVRATASAGSRRLSGALVVSEIALAFTLLAVSAVLIGDVGALQRAWPGFDMGNLLTLQLTLPDAITANADARVAHQIRLVEALASVPGVEAVGFSNQTPLNGCCLSTALYPDGSAIDLAAPQKVAFMPVNPGYFQALGLTLKAGRLLAYGDQAGDDMLTVVINEAAARHYWGARDPIGTFGRISRPDGTRFHVVGVVGDIRNDGIDKPTVPEIYMLHAAARVNPMHFVVRSRLPLQTLLPQIRTAVQRVDPSAADPPGRDDERSADDVAGTSAGGVLHGDVLRARRAAARHAGTLRRDVVLGAAAPGRVRHADGARRARAGSARAGPRQRCQDGGLWRRRRCGCRRRRNLVPGAASPGSTHHVDAVRIVDRDRGRRLDCRVARARLASDPLLADAGDSRRPGRRRADRTRGLARNVRRAVPDDCRVGDAAVADDSALLTEFVDAARRAVSNDEALRLALTTVRTRLDAESAMVVENLAGAVYPCAAAAATDGRPAVLIPACGFLLNRLQNHASALPITAADIDAWLVWARATAAVTVDEIQALGLADVRLAVALRGKEEILGMLLMGPPIGRLSYSYAERRVLRQSADQLALMLENARLNRRILDQERLRRDVALAAEVQRRLLPAAAPVGRPTSLAAVTVAARSVAGDYYDFLALDDGRLGLALADVSGKGVAAALIMSVVQASLRIISSDAELPLPDLAERMNQFLYRSTQSTSYATFFYARIDEQSLQLDYVNAGHNPPYLIRRGNSGVSIEPLPAGGTVLGLFPEASYEGATLALEAGDILFIFSDGFPTP